MMDTKKALSEAIMTELKDFLEGELPPGTSENSYFGRDLGMDSLDRFEFCYKVEEGLRLRIPDEKIWDLENVNDYTTYIESHPGIREDKRGYISQDNQ